MGISIQLINELENLKKETFGIPILNWYLSSPLVSFTDWNIFHVSCSTNVCKH